LIAGARRYRVARLRCQECDTLDEVFLDTTEVLHRPMRVSRWNGDSCVRTGRAVGVAGEALKDRGAA